MQQLLLYVINYPQRRINLISCYAGVTFQFAHAGSKKNTPVS